MSIKRTPALDTSHPFSGLAQPDEADTASTTAETTEETGSTTPASAPTDPPAKPAGAAAAPAAAPAATAEPYAGSAQMNIRAAEVMRTHLRITAAGMTLATGEKWSQDRLVRHAVAAYLAQLGDEFNNGKPFHER